MPSNASASAAAHSLLAPEPTRRRAVFEYPVPKEVSWDGDEHTIGFIELDTNEELMATKRAKTPDARLAFEMVKASLYEVDGERVSLGDGSADLAWKKFGAPLRNLAMEAYAEIHSPSDEAKQTFLKGRKVKV